MLGDRRIWALLLISCAALGAEGVRRMILPARPKLGDREASLHDIATQHLQEADALEKLRGALMALPGNGKIVFFGSSSSWGASEIYLLSCYVAWPRQVWFVPTDPRPLRPFPPVPDGTGADAVVFFETEPPAEFAAKALRIGSKLAIVVKSEGVAK